MQKEQLRIAAAIAAIAVSYYIKGLQLQASFFFAAYVVAGSLLMLCWGLYILMIAVATSDDLLWSPISSKWCLRAKKAAHFFFYAGIVGVVLVAILFALAAITTGPSTPSGS